MSRPTDELPIVLVPHPHVRVDKTVLGGSPYVVGSRVPVRRIWAFYRNGANADTILKRFPQLSPGKVFDALAFAFDNAEVIEADLEREKHMLKGKEERPKGKPIRQMELPFEGEEDE